jgi:hypothetical protein
MKKIFLEIGQIGYLKIQEIYIDFNNVKLT